MVGATLLPFGEENGGKRWRTEKLGIPIIQQPMFLQQTDIKQSTLPHELANWDQLYEFSISILVGSIILYINNYKKQYAEQEFNALKRRCKAQIGQRCTCIVTVRNEEKNNRHTVLKSVVGTLDLMIGHLSHGEDFPGERVNAQVFCNIERRSSNRYGYIANLCVAKSARRQGVARNMLHYAIRSAKANGAEKVFVHVHTNNGPAQKLYQKVGFEVVQVPNLKLSEEQPHLLLLAA
nr:uncharacterized protein LOC104105190 [Nicotiana tomentosiformis]